MPNYSDHKKVVNLLEMAQEADKENREKAKEARRFVNTRNGQWEDSWWRLAKDKPRYQFDMTTNAVNIVSGELDQADFNISVDPAGGDASETTAQTLDGIVRNIENLSKATNIFNRSGRMMIKCGMDGWEVVQEYAHADSFEQDLKIKPIHNFTDRVWFDHAFEEQNASDARHCFKLTAVACDVFEEKHGRKGKSLTIFQRENTDKDVVIAGQVYYFKETRREIVLMSNNRVYPVDEKFEQVKDELALAGVFEKKRRSRPEKRVFIRQFDAEGFLGEEQETVFGMLPIVPTFGNFEVFENSVIYFGMIEKMMDPQRVLNYNLSREVEEGALAPRAKIIADKRHVGADPDIQKGLETMNTNTDPVQFIEMQEDIPNPYQIQGAQVNAGLRVVSESMRGMLLGTSGQFSSAQGDNPGLQSGVAIDKLQAKSDTSTAHYFSAQEFAIGRTGEIIVDAIPRIYDTPRLVRVIDENGSAEMVSLYDQVPDQQTGRMIELHDLSKGIYDVTCSAGPAFRNRQQQTVDAITSIGSIDPSFVQLGGDILASNFDSPGMDMLAERKRRQLFQSGAIPLEQMTEDEKQEFMQSQQEQKPDPMMVAAQAEMEKANAEMAKVQSEREKFMVEMREKELNLQIKGLELELKGRDQQLKEAKFSVDAANTEAKTQGQLIQNQISAEELSAMPTEKLIDLYTKASAGRPRFVFDPKTERITRASG